MFEVRKTEKKEFKVGDMIITKNFTGISKRFVTRVTKTQAICVVKRADGTSYTAKYRKEYEVWECDGKKHFHVDPVPRIEWDMNERSVITREEYENDPKILNKD